MAKSTTSGENKSAKSATEKVGAWAFLIGVIIAIILGAIPSTAGRVWVIALLLILGIIVGFLNISDKEIMPFLIACIAFLVAAPAFGLTVSNVVGGFDWLSRILSQIAVLVLPGAIIASIKAIFALASSK